jgi:hypothetical protein
MRMPNRSILASSRLTPIAACVAAVLALATPAAMAATTWTVNTCADDNSGSTSAHTGTLRYTVFNAVTGDTIDMTGLTCSTISLVTGAIVVNEDALTWNGPTAGHLVVRNGQSPASDRVVNHQGTGLLYIENISIANGNVIDSGANVYGGCIYSRGNVELSHVVVQSCSATTSHSAYGGAIFTKGDLSVKYSTISGGKATGENALGGGAFVGGGLFVESSSIQGNSATSSASGVVPIGTKFGEGGGLYLQGGAYITASTISGNNARLAGGIMSYSGSPGSTTVTIANSTISENSASAYVGGIFSNTSVTLENSTIAYNTAVRGKTIGNFPAAAGLDLLTGASITVNLQSALIASNTYGSTNLDFSAETRADEGGTGGSLTITGHNNLIRVIAATTAKPPGTLQSCPLLGPLRNNGGPTATHALMSHSPAIDAGNNSAGFTDDQRGPPYLRTSGTAADIGAYEVQQADIIFNSGFDGCP